MLWGFALECWNLFGSCFSQIHFVVLTTWPYTRNYGVNNTPNFPLGFPPPPPPHQKCF